MAKFGVRVQENRRSALILEWE